MTHLCWWSNIEVLLKAFMYGHFNASVPPDEHYVSVLVCMRNEPAHTYLHPGTHSSSLCLCDSTMVAAVLSLLGEVRVR